MLKQKLQTDQIQALKNKDNLRLDTLRLILSQIKNREIEKGSELNDEEVIAVMRKFVKELNESIAAFEKGGRKDLVDKHRQQLEVVQTYLPKELSDEDLKQEVKKIIEANQELYQKNPKAIIGVCIRNLKNKVDSSRIVKTIQSL